MDFESIIRPVRRGWAVLAASALVGGAAGYALTLVQPATYEAATSLYVSVPGASNSSELAQGGTAAEQKVQSFAKVAVSSRVLEPVVEELGLDVTPEELARHVRAQTPIDSVVVDITVSDGDPTQAAAIANGIGASLTRVVTTQLEEPAQGASPFRISTIEPAVAPQAPASPNVMVNIAGGLAIGLLLGFAVAALRTALDNRLESRTDVEALAGAPAIGELTLEKSLRDDPLVFRAQPTSPVAEGFRRLRMNLQFLEVGRSARSFVVTSSVPGEGKTTTVANIALALAENGLRVALVDADLRRPRIADVMGVDGTAGLTDVLIGRLELEDAEQPWGRDGLVVLPSGAIPPNPTELLGSGAMGAVLAELERRFDVVLLDAPPLLPVADAAVLSTMTGGTLLVAALHRTTRKQLAGARAVLGDVGRTAVGTIMTMAKPRRRSVYDYQYEASSTSNRLVIGADDALSQS
jgi:capsular exopolysaccharide synthesis family protein